MCRLQAAPFLILQVYSCALSSRLIFQIRSLLGFIFDRCCRLLSLEVEGRTMLRVSHYWVTWLDGELGDMVGEASIGALLRYVPIERRGGRSFAVMVGDFVRSPDRDKSHSSTDARQG